MTTLKKTCIALFVYVISISAFSLGTPQKQFIQQLVTQDHFSRAKLVHLFRHLHHDRSIIAAMTRPFEKQPWSYYRNFFVTPKRVRLGAEYLKHHHYALMRMQKKYGIPASIITAILGIETEYGRHLGKYSVLRTLYTLSFYYPPREKFFKKELAQYFILARQNHLDMSAIKGSYAGALGIPQFMPSSYRRFGVSFAKRGSVNLFHHNDAIASVANYFHKNGWRANQRIARQLKSKHSYVNKKIGREITLPLRDRNQYWEIYKNFDVIMSYNHNIVYAMAVYQLSQAIEKQYARIARR